MKDTPLTVAQKIRAARQRLGITQATLAGEQITRNMLCRIEGGTVTASRATLAYLAEELHLPLLYLLDDRITLTEALKVTYMPDVRRAFSAGHYKEAARLIDKHFREPDDEIALILASSCIELAKTALHTGNLDTAAKHVKKAEDAMRQTVLPTKHLAAAASLLRAVIKNVQSPRHEIADADVLCMTDDAAMTDLFYYLTENVELTSDKLRNTHLVARRALRDRDYRTALKLLHELEEHRTEKEMGAFLLFRVYTDLEQCYRETSDYETAYRYASKRISMLAAFKS